MLGISRLPCPVHGNRNREWDADGDGWPAVAGDASLAVAGDGVDVAGRHLLAVERALVAGHHPHPVVECVGDQQVAGAVSGYLSR